MPYSAYKYYDDLSNLWQLQLPQDFAAALNLVPASGSEPYLDPSISPRVATYRCTAPLSVRTAVVGTVTQFGPSLPSLLTVNGLNYYLQSAIGEAIPPYPTGNQVLAQGPQGPPGTFGTVANNVIVGNISGANVVPVGLTQAQATALLNLFTASLQGLVPASGGGTTEYLRADGTWDTVSGLSAISNDQVLGNISGSSALPVGLTQTQLTALINSFSSSLPGAAPASGGGTTNYLRADGSWSAPPGIADTLTQEALATSVTSWTAGSYKNVLSITLAAGTYLILANARIQEGATGSQTWAAALGVSGTQSVISLLTSTGAGANATVFVAYSVTLSSTTTIWLQVNPLSYTNGTVYGAYNNSTQIIALQLG